MSRQKTLRSLSRHNSSITWSSTVYAPKAVWSGTLTRVAHARNAVRARRHYRVRDTVATCHILSRQKCPALNQPLSQHYTQCRDMGPENLCRNKNLEMGSSPPFSILCTSKFHPISIISILLPTVLIFQAI